MSNVIPFAAVQDDADDVTLALVTASDRMLDVIKLTDLIRQPVVRDAIKQDASDGLTAIRAALLAVQRYHMHRAAMADEVRELKRNGTTT